MVELSNLIFLTPCRPKFPGDVQTRMALAEIWPGLGLEFVGPLDDYLNHQGKIIENLKGYGGPAVLHFPFEWKSVDGATDLSTKLGLENLLRVLEFAEKIKVAKVICHAGVVMQTPRYVNIRDEKEKIWEELTVNLSIAVKSFGGVVCLENMPFPLMGDVIDTEKEMIWDPFFKYLGELTTFCQQTGTKVCFDTCHYGTIKTDIATAAETLLQSGCLAHVHISDVYGQWIDGVSKFSEGIVPGKGNIGIKEFGKFFRFLRDSGQKITATLEVADTDFEKCEKTRETIAVLPQLLAA